MNEATDSQVNQDDSTSTMGSVDSDANNDTWKDEAVCDINHAGVVDASGSVEMACIPPGTFMMGSPETQEEHREDEIQHEVTLTGSFWMMTAEVTQGMWEELLGRNPAYFPSCGLDCPVEQVGWWDVIYFANALSEKDGLPSCYDLSGCTGTPGAADYACPDVVLASEYSTPYSCQGYRLPTEAEWEYAARAGEDYLYAGSNDVDVVAWYGDNSGGTTHPIKGKLPNAWGLYDMTGNVREWVWDWYADYSTSAVTDPAGPSVGSDRVARGGSWFLNPPSERVAARFHDVPSFHYYCLGVRLVKSN